MKSAIVCTLALIVLPQLSVAQTQQVSQADCQAFETAIESGVKGVALILAEGIIDNSAPRQTYRSADINNKLQIINLNLLLEVQNKCPIRKTPIVPSIYLSEALDCNLAQVKGEKDSPACDMKNWKGIKK